MRNLLLVAALLGTALSGCVDEPVSDVEGQAVELVDATAAALAGEPAANIDLLGHWEVTGGEEIDAWEDLLFVDRGPQIEIVRTHATEGSVTFEEVSTFDGAPGPKDVKVSDDGQWLFIGNDEQLSAIEGVPVPGRAGGFYVVDVSDPAAPQLESFLAVGPTRGPHMVFYHQRSDGSEYVYGANGDVSINAFDRPSGTLLPTATYRPDPITEVNRDPEVIDLYYQLYTHDMFVWEEPEDALADAGKTLMATASWDAGVHIVDVTDPFAPEQLGYWNDFPAGHTGNVHTVATDWIGDRRITVGAVEIGFEIVGGIPYLLDQERSVVYVWDTTDPANIEMLGFWENPMGLTPGQGGLVMSAVTGDELRSTHNVQFEDGRIYMAHYGLGIWVLDVSTPEKQAAPETVAFYDHDGMNAWDVLLQDGVIYSSGAVGVQALHFLPDTLGEAGIDGRA